jgi:hypothetical protein
MHGLLAVLANSWLVHDKWIVPLATILAAIGAIAAAVIAAYIGYRASQVAQAQRDVAGLAEVNKLISKLETPRWQKIQRHIAIDYLVGRVDRLYAREILNLIEDLGLFVERHLLSLDIVESIMAYDVICWWYAVHSVVESERHAVQDMTLWGRGQRLVMSLHASSEAQGITAWAGPPKEALMRELFLDTLWSQSQRRKEGIEYEA